LSRADASFSRSQRFHPLIIYHIPPLGKRKIAGFSALALRAAETDKEAITICIVTERAGGCTVIKFFCQAAYCTNFARRFFNIIKRFFRFCPLTRSGNCALRAVEFAPANLLEFT
ncbi:MAG: hypothetical protein LIO52_01075, partial [Oscillospiraceae bacterium]|nr:hypothetical protein [Oscillospiraceae bacterium]